MKIQMIPVLALCCVVSWGCKPAATSSTSSPKAGSETAGATDSHADHDHEAAGPHGGHLLHLEPTGSHAEWAHDDDQHLITVYLDEFDPAQIATVKFTAKIGDATEEFQLTNGGDGWTITSPELLTHINMKDAAEVNLIVVDDAGVHTAKIEAHDDHHHH